MISYQPFPASFTTFTSSPFFREAMGVPLVLGSGRTLTPVAAFTTVAVLPVVVLGVVGVVGVMGVVVSGSSGITPGSELSSGSSVSPGSEVSFSVLSSGCTGVTTPG